MIPFTQNPHTAKTSYPLFKSENESEVAQSCLTLCSPMNCSLPGSSIHGIFQARILEWVAFPSPGDLPDPGIEPRSPTLTAFFFFKPFEPPGKSSFFIELFIYVQLL